MCGIAGWNLTDKAPDVFYTCLAIDMVERGTDSWGFYNGVAITKGLDNLAMSVAGSAIASLHGFLHTRHATMGKATKDNSHPFRIGNLVGAHNGVIDNHTALNIRFERKCEVDSQHIFEHIVAGLPLSDLKGYGAIQYHRDGAYYIGRCNDGVLCCALTSIGTVWASTAYAIELACLHSGVEVKMFYEVEAGKLYRVEVDGLYHTDQTFQFAKREENAKDWRSFGKGSNFGFTQFGKETTETDKVYGLQDDAPYGNSAYFDEMAAIDDLQSYGIEWGHSEEQYDECVVCNYDLMTIKYEGQSVCAECLLELVKV